MTYDPKVKHHIDPDERFGPAAERFARFFGTVEYLMIQTVIVAIWIALNGLGIAFKWDPYPFILLNLVFSTQAAYAAPLILLAQNRQADRDKHQAELDAKHREDLAQLQLQELQRNTALTEKIDALTEQLHQHMIG